MSNERLYDAAMDAINALFGDQNVSRSETKNNLNSLIGEIEIMLNALDHDEQMEDMNNG